MLVNTIVAVIAAFVLMYVVASIIRAVGLGGIATLVLQTVTISVMAYALTTVSYIGVLAAIALVVLPLAVRIFAIVWFYWQAKKILNGDYGEEARWAAELTQEGDSKFVEASTKLNKFQNREVGIISDSKAELRENTIERAEENDAN